MNIDELLELKEKNVSFGSHGVNHVNLNSMSDKEILNEITASKKWIKDTIGVTAKILSLPRGRYNSFVLSQARKMGYEHVLSIIPFKNKVGSGSPYLLGRIVVDPNDGIVEFLIKCLGGYACWGSGKAKQNGLK